MVGAAVGSLLTYAEQRRASGWSQRRRESSLIKAPTNSDAKRSCGMKALLVTGDTEVVCIFSQLFGEMEVETQRCTSEADAIERLLSEKYEAVILDLDGMPESARIIEMGHRTCPKDHAVVFALATGIRAKEAAAALSNPVVIERPFAPSEIRNLIRTRYGRMLRDRLDYFRLPVEIPISIRSVSGDLTQCMMINLSQNGMAVSAPCSFEVGGKLNIVFAIPNGNVFVSAEGTVIWDDKHGKAGITFRCTSSSVQERLFEWLHDQFFMKVRTGTIETDASRGFAAGF
jgi:hypothetical protein